MFSCNLLVKYKESTSTIVFSFLSDNKLFTYWTVTISEPGKWTIHPLNTHPRHSLHHTRLFFRRGGFRIPAVYWKWPGVRFTRSNIKVSFYCRVFHWKNASLSLKVFWALKIWTLESECHYESDHFKVPFWMVLILNFQDHRATAKAMPAHRKPNLLHKAAILFCFWLSVIIKINLITLNTDFWLWVTCLSSAVVPSWSC